MARPPFNSGVERRLRLTQKKLAKRAERERRRLGRRQKSTAGENSEFGSFPPRAEQLDLVEYIEGLPK